jgi:hypothetical protein
LAEVVSVLAILLEITEIILFLILHLLEHLPDVLLQRAAEVLVNHLTVQPLGKVVVLEEVLVDLVQTPVVPVSPVKVMLVVQQ